MGEIRSIQRFLTGHRVVAFDTMVLVYHLERHPAYSPITLEFFSTIQRGAVTSTTSAVTVAEMLVRPVDLGETRVVADYLQFLLDFPNLDVIPMGIEVAIRAAELRASHRLRLPDALHVASALASGATGFLTNDRRLARVSEIEVLILDDCIPASAPQED